MMGMLNQLCDSQMPGDGAQKTTFVITAPTSKSTPTPSNTTTMIPSTMPIPTANLLSTPVQISQQVAKIYSDPLREIVHLSDSKDNSEVEGKIKNLAVEAANLYHVEEVIPIARVNKFYIFLEFN